MEKFPLIDDASIQNRRASDGGRGAHSEKDPTWRSQHTHERCAKTFNLLFAGARFTENIRRPIFWVLSTSSCCSGEVRLED